LEVTQQVRLPTSAMRRYFFPVAAAIFIALTLAAFGDNLVTDIRQPSNADPKFVIHALFCGAWVILLLAQSLLVGRRNMRTHRKLGMAGMGIALGVTLTTVWLFVSVWKGWAAMDIQIRANRLLLPSFSLFVVLAYLNRHRSDWHKRLIYTGTLFILEPILARAYDPLLVPLMIGWTVPQVDAAFIPSLFASWLVFYGALFVYDVRTIARIHPVTIGATIWFGAIWAIVIAV
jgi:hypothetical protein